MGVGALESGMDERAAFWAVEDLEATGGREAVVLAMHAALLESFHIEILGLLRRNFMPAARGGTELSADVAFSSLCEPLGGGYFRFDPGVRATLLEDLATTYPGEQPSRIRRVAAFVLCYAVHRERHGLARQDRLLRSHLETQRWVALAFLDPGAAAAQLAEALDSAADSESAGVAVRLGAVASVLSVPLRGHRDLVDYALGVADLRDGKLDAARARIGYLGDAPVREGKVQLASASQLLAEVDAATHEAAGTTADVQPLDEETAGRDSEKREQPASEEPPRARAGAGPKIYISYRREDAAGWVGRVYDQLASVFGSDALFMDVESIELGTDYVEHIQGQISNADVVLVVIGHRWLASRLDQPDDLVRREVATALKTDRRVIPVLVDGAELPAWEALPEDIRDLTSRQAVAISPSRFDDDMQSFADQLRRVAGLESLEQPTDARREKGESVASLSASIMIAYRRDDTRQWASAIYSGLKNEFGEGAVFMDVQSILPGVEIQRAIRQQIEAIDVMLVLIGRRGLAAGNAKGLSEEDALNHSLDMFRMEIGAALAGGKFVVPILVDGADFPDPESIPEDIRSLATRNAILIDAGHFDKDMEKLTGLLREYAPLQSTKAAKSRGLFDRFRSFFRRDDSD